MKSSQKQQSLKGQLSKFISDNAFNHKSPVLLDMRTGKYTPHHAYLDGLCKIFDEVLSSIGKEIEQEKIVLHGDANSGVGAIHNNTLDRALTIINKHLEKGAIN